VLLWGTALSSSESFVQSDNDAPPGEGDSSPQDDFDDRLHALMTSRYEDDYYRVVEVADELELAPQGSRGRFALRYDMYESEMKALGHILGLEAPLVKCNGRGYIVGHEWQMRQRWTHPENVTLNNDFVFSVWKVTHRPCDKPVLREECSYAFCIGQTYDENHDVREKWYLLEDYEGETLTVDLIKECYELVLDLLWEGRTHEDVLYFATREEAEEYLHDWIRLNKA